MPPLRAAILGPTASGKSALALSLAEKSGAHIACMDAFQIYRGLDTGTGKPTPDEQQQVPHHLLDLASPAEPFTVADYLDHAQKLLNRSGSVPLLWTGGTGFYHRALTKGLSPAPASDPAVLSELEQLPAEELARQVQETDPEWAATADLQNPRRTARALAVYRQTGKPLSWWHARPRNPLLPGLPTLVIETSLEELRIAISRRVESMWDSGWPGEVENLLRINGWPESQSYQAIGYPLVVQHLRGELGKAQCLERIKTETGQYAKRQMTWCRSLPKAIPVSPGTPPEEILSRIARLPETP